MKITKNDHISLKSTQVERIKSKSVLGKKHLLSSDTVSPEKSLITSRSLENLLSSLKSPQVMKLKVLEKVLSPLGEVIQLLLEITRDPIDGNSLLIEKFISSWLKKYGEHLPLKQKKDLTGLSNLLRSQRLESVDDENKSVYSINSDGERENPPWKVQFQYRKKTGSERHEHQIACIFDLNMEHLGEVRTVVTAEENHNDCLFQSACKETAKWIRDSLPIFRKQLEERGVVLNHIHVSRKREDLSKEKSFSSKGLDLWG